jgi:hypothetical protein
MATRIVNDSYLSPDQLSAVSRVRSAADSYRMARVHLERQLREQLQRELSGLLAVRDNEVRVAYALGVRKATLKRAIGSKDHATLQNVLSVGGTLVMPDTSQVSWTDKNSFVLHYVDYAGQRVYGRVEGYVTLSDGSSGDFVAWDVVSGDVNDPLFALIDSTTARGDLSVYDAISDVVRR